MEEKAANPMTETEVNLEADMQAAGESAETTMEAIATEAEAATDTVTESIPEMEDVQEDVGNAMDSTADAMESGIEATGEAMSTGADAVIGTVMSIAEPTTTSNAGIDLGAIGESTVYLMGLSFIIGSLFTILILLVFDFMRRNNSK